MEIVAGTGSSGKPRQLDCHLTDAGRISLWIHSPDSSTNGWEIHVDPGDLFRALATICFPSNETATALPDIPLGTPTIVDPDNWTTE